MTLDDEQISALRVTLLENGSAWATDVKGDRLFLIHSRIMPGMPEGILISYEGNGTLFFPLDRPMNRFRLISAGFPLTVAHWLADLINRLTGFAKPSEKPPERPKRPLRIAAQSRVNEETKT